MNDIPKDAQDDARHGFEALGIDPTLVAALRRLELDAPTDIQRLLIPIVMEGRDCLVQASTGAGKTNTYLLPILQRVRPGEGLQALVIQPTRSLALKLEANIHRFAPERPLRAAVSAGGRPARSPSDAPADAPVDAPDVLIATPRGAAELVRRGRTDWSAVQIVVFDELDAIIDDRGPEPLRQIHSALPEAHQTILIAGELDEQVRALANELLRDPFQASAEPGQPRASEAEQCYFSVPANEKLDVLISFCKQVSPKLALVMANSAKRCRDLVGELQRKRITCRWIEEPRRAGREQADRQERRPRSEVILASDPPPRRLSTIPASHLVNYELPPDADGYLARLRQAARLRRHGMVITLVEPGQQSLLEEIEQRLGKKLRKLETPQRPRRRREESRTSDRPAPSLARPAKTPPSPATSTEGGGRLNQVLRRDEELEARGVRPVPRTLGSRFHSTRRGKPLRRPGPPK